MNNKEKEKLSSYTEHSEYEDEKNVSMNVPTNEKDKSIRRDSKRKREEIKNSTIGGF